MYTLLLLNQKFKINSEKKITDQVTLYFIRQLSANKNYVEESIQK